MANCYRCAHAKEIERLQKICLECSIGKEDCGLSHGGKSWVSMDATEKADLVLDGRTAPEYSVPEYSPLAGIGGEDEEEEEPTQDEIDERLLSVVRLFADIPVGCADIVSGMLRGETLAEMAKASKSSIQALHQRWKRVCAANPVWHSIETGMIGRGIGRKKQTFDAECANAARQMELGL